MTRELAMVGWQFISRVSRDLKNVTVTAEVSGREQHLEVHLPSGYPKQPPTYEALLPVPLNLTVSLLMLLMLTEINMAESYVNET